MAPSSTPATRTLKSVNFVGIIHLVNAACDKCVSRIAIARHEAHHAWRRYATKHPAAISEALQPATTGSTQPVLENNKQLELCFTLDTPCQLRR
jgi:hypothetical protein